VYNKLVSVCVLSYNSEKTIIETLNSIKNQTYKRLELVVSDDCSTDGTGRIVRNWLETNIKHFESVQYVIHDENIGVSKNINSAISLCKGEWIKTIAADDILEEKCIETFLNMICSDNEQYSFYYSLMDYIDEFGNKIEKMKTDCEKKIIEISKNETIYDQLRYFREKNEIGIAPSLFYRKDAFENAGGADERIRNIEDYPLIFRMIEKGYFLRFCPEELVKYRIHNSISNSNEGVFHAKFIPQQRLLKKYYYYPYRKKSDLRYWTNEFVRRLQEDVVIKCFSNKKNVLSTGFILVTNLLNPFNWKAYMRALRNKLFKRR